MKRFPITDQTRALIPGILNYSGREGLDLAEQRRRVRVLDAVETLDETACEIALEDADHSTLLTAIKSCRLHGVSRDFMALADAIEKAETTNKSAP